MPPKIALQGLGLDLSVLNADNDNVEQHSCTLSISSSSSDSNQTSGSSPTLLASPYQSACPSPILTQFPPGALSSIPASPILLPASTSTQRVISLLKRRRKRPDDIPLPCAMSSNQAASPILPPLARKTSAIFQTRLKHASASSKNRAVIARPSLKMLLLLLTACLSLLTLMKYFPSALTSSSSTYPVHSQPSFPRNPQTAAQDRDSLILYRIIGNDLPPRHAPNQTLSNLRFLLQNEVDFTSALSLQSTHVKKVEKYFVLNRITSDSLLSRVKSLLAEFHIDQSRILEIPFEWEEYELRSMKWDSAVADATGIWGIGRPPAVNALTREDDLQASQLTNQTIAAIEATERLPIAKGKRKQRVQSIGKLRAIDFTFHDKNLYAINNNGGRNFALHHGRSLGRSRWILPLDGNSFFTPPAMDLLIRQLEEAGEGSAPKRHVVIPMSRLLDNEHIRSNNTLQFDRNAAAAWAPAAVDEPQVGFRFDSEETFQPAMRYGRRSKLEFLWRLGAVSRSRNLDKRTLPWEQSDRDHLTAETFASIKTEDDKGVYSTAGFIEAAWVYRLFSGNQHQEHSTQEASSLRNINRIKGIVSHLERLDERLARGHLCAGQARCGFHQGLTWSWSLDALQDFKEQLEDGEVTAIGRISDLREESEAILNRWAMPAISHVDENEAAQHALTLAVTGYLAGDSHFSDLAVRIIKSRFAPSSEQVEDWLYNHSHLEPVDGEGYIFPLVMAVDVVPPLWTDLVKRQAQSKQSLAAKLPYNPYHFDPIPLTDAIRLLSRTSTSLELPKHSMHALLSAHLAWLVSDTRKLAEAEHPQSEKSALSYDMQVAALAAFVDDVRLVSRIVQRAQIRSPDHILHPVLAGHLKNLRMAPAYHDAFITEAVDIA